MLDRCIWVRRSIQQLKDELQELQEQFAGQPGFSEIVDLKKAEIQQEELRLALCGRDGLPADGFLFDRNITDEEQERLIDRHNFAYQAIGACTSLGEVERDFLRATTGAGLVMA